MAVASAQEDPDDAKGEPKTMAHALPDPAVSNAIARLKRIEGQARGVQQMLLDGRPCDEVIMQLSAMRAAINKLAVTIITESLEQCLHDTSTKANTEEELAQAKRALLRFS